MSSEGLASQALAYLDLACRLQPDIASHRARLAFALDACELHDAAQEAYSAARAMTVPATMPELWIQSARLSLDRDQTNTALALLRECLPALPASPQFWDLLAEAEEKAAAEAAKTDQFCTECGVRQPHDARFCDQCGSALGV